VYPCVPAGVARDWGGATAGEEGSEGALAAGQVEVGELHAGSALMAAPGAGEAFEFDADVAGLDGSC